MPGDGPLFLPPPAERSAYDSVRLPPAFQQPQDGLGTVYPGAWTPVVVDAQRPPCYQALQMYGSDLLHRVGADHVHYYSVDNLVLLGVGVGVAAVLANTAADQNFRNYYQSKIRNEKTDQYCEALHVPRVLGDGAYTIPILAGATLAGPLFPESRLAAVVGRWGQRSLRGMLVGWPPLLAMQYITGASRPGESTHSSHWQPFRDNNGVSGHTFMGAIPFLTAAMMTERPLLQLGFVFVSTWAGVSRINDDGHYLSQVLLGWWMGYLAARCVNQTEHAAARIEILPVATADGMMATAMLRW